MASTDKTPGSGDRMLQRNMRLFGMPYQFSETADPRYSGLSDKIGRSYVNKILTQAPVIYIVPGIPAFLPGVNDDDVRQGITAQLLDLMQGNLKNFFQGTSKDDIRYYDFQEAYGEYMQYVNMMCRTTATFMQLGQHIPMGSGESKSLQQYNWKDYGWDREKYGGAWKNQVSYLLNTGWDAATGFFGKVGNAWSGNAITDDISFESGDTSSAGSSSYNQNFIQFYVDPSSGSSTQFGNSTGPSSIKGMLDTASQSVKEFKFVADAGNIDLEGLQEIGSSAIGALSDIADNAGSIGKALNRILSVGSSVIRGENVILPEIYQDSDFGQDYNINISLRSPYGNRFAVYMDVIVPLLHLIALVAPRQKTANSYGSPFLVKVYYPGVFNINLGIVESLQISRPSNDDSWSVDGLPTEIEVSLRIKDLYSDFSMNPTTAPKMFANNSSLIDYLSTIAGVNLSQPQLETKVNQWVNANITRITDVPQNAMSVASDFFSRKFLNIVSL